MAQPFEVTDFSGGITENIVQSDPRRYATAQNYLITTDKKLQERNGMVVYEPLAADMRVPVKGRVNGLFSVINESILLTQSGQDIYSYTKNSSTPWTEILGPSGNHALQASPYSQTSYGEFQRQVYFTSDVDLGALPTKLYRDTTNTWQAKTVGLPRSYVMPVWSSASLLQACITLANALRASFLLHFNNNAGYTGVTGFNAFKTDQYLHQRPDYNALSYFQTVTPTPNSPGLPWPMPSPLPTPAPAATTQSTLFSLVTALVNAYQWHMEDSTQNSLSPYGNLTAAQAGFYQVHWNYRQINYLPVNAVGPAIPLSDQTLTVNLIQAALQLNDLFDKWYFHQNAIYTHSYFDQPSFYQQYLISSTLKIQNLQYTVDANNNKIIQTNCTPLITPNWTDFFQYANNLKSLHNNHVQNLMGGFSQHFQADTYYGNIDVGSFYGMASENFPNCTDLNSMYVLIYRLRNKYTWHLLDANNSQTSAFVGFTAGSTTSPQQTNYTVVQCTASTTSGSSSVTSLTPVNTAITLSIVNAVAGTGAWIVFTNVSTQAQPQSATNPAGGSCNFGQIENYATGTATMDRQATTTATATPCLVITSYMRFHYALSSTGGYTSVVQGQQSPNSEAELASGASAYGTDVSSWKALADEYFFAFATHGTDITTHSGGNALAVQWLNSISSVAANITNGFFIPTLSSFAYAFYWSDEYTVEPNGIEYLVNSNPVLSTASFYPTPYPPGYTLPSQNTVFYTATPITVERAISITGLPTLTNTNQTNYATSNIQFNIYRTMDSQTVFFQVAQVANGTTSYSDITTDTINMNGVLPLEDQPSIYTTGGVVGSDQLQGAKFVTIINGTAFYGGIYDTGQFFPNRIRQSLQLAPDNCPATFFDDYDDEITGLSSARGQLIVFCTDSVYRTSGGFNELGQGSLTHDRISDRVGCLNAKSIVQTEIGVFFAGSDGFYYTDSYQLIKVSLEIDLTYKNLTQSQSQQQSIIGGYDKYLRRVWWAMKNAPNDAENSIFYVLHLTYGVKPSGAFTTVNFNFLPSSIVFQNGSVIMGSSLGYVLREDVWTKTDPVFTNGIQTGTALIPFEFTTAALDLGSIFQRKYITKIHILGNNEGNQALQIVTIRDKNADYKGIKQTAPVNYRDNLTWGDPTCVWGSDTLVVGEDTIQWGNEGKMDIWRRIPRTGLRNDLFQLSIRPGYVMVYASEEHYPYGAFASTNTSTKVITLVSPSGYTLVWPLDVVGYNFTLETDEYTKEYAITAVSGNTITVLDTANLLPTVTQSNWVIRGYKKEQRSRIDAYVLHFDQAGDKVQAYKPDVGDHPGNVGVVNGGE